MSSSETSTIAEETKSPEPVLTFLFKSELSIIKLNSSSLGREIITKIITIKI